MRQSKAKQPRGGRAWAVLAIAFVACCTVPASASSAPTATVLQDTGEKSNRIDILFIGDGYTAAELPTTYVDHVNNVVSHMFDTGGINAGVTNPYARYQNFFNIVRVDVESNESGVDRYGPNNTVIELFDTALSGRLGATYQGVYYDRALRIDHIGAVPYFANQALPAISYSLSDMDWQFALVNTPYYGGEASSFATFAAANPNAAELALHEGGHWNHDLGDEYGGNGQNYNFNPNELNLTTDPAGSKWSQWLGYIDPQTGYVDAYESGLGYDTGIYHPSPDSKMNSLNVAFDPIAREKIILDIYALIDPIDSALDNAPTYTLDDDLWVQVVDPAVVLVQWLIDGQALPGQSAETLDLRQVVSLIGPGSHTLTARAYDSILDHNFSDNDNPDPLDLVRRDLDQLEQAIAYNVDIVYLPGDTDFDGDVDQHDLNTVIQAYGNTVTAGDAASGDVTGDGGVGIDDLDTVLARWTSQAQPVMVPEPATALPIILAIVFYRRRRR